MLLLRLGLVLCTLLQFGLAQDSADTSTDTSSPSSTSSSATPTHTISAGAQGFVFTPDSVTADVGEVVEFLFYPLNHSVARAEFQNPCIPYEVTGAGKQGFWSGFHPLNVVASNPPSFQIKINDTQPIFFYCSAPGACADGMVGVINPNDTQTLSIQEEFSLNSNLSFSPGENFPAETAPASSSPTLTSIPSFSPITTSAATTSDSGSKISLSGGAVAGIVIGVSVVLVLACSLVYMCARQRTIKEVIQRQSTQPDATSPFMPGHISTASVSTNPPNGFDNFGARRYSDRPNSMGHFERSKSPLMGNGPEALFPTMDINSFPSNPNTTHIGSPHSQRHMVERASVTSQFSSPTPANTAIFQAQPGAVIGELEVQRGPHELDVNSQRSTAQ